MKNIFAGVVCMCLLGGTVACTDFLTEKPKSELSVEQYFAVPDHARAVVNKLYREGATSFHDAGDFYGGPASMYGGYISGLFSNIIYKGQRPIAQWSPVLTHTSENISEEMDNVWNSCYKTIGMANTAIKYVPTTPGLNKEEMDRLMAEAKFFRAYNYFYLVKFFGDVPLLIEPYESLNNLYVSRTPSVEVYAQLEKDLKEALTGGLKNECFAKNGFRITQAAAETLLANVYLQMSGYPLLANKYADAATQARNVIKAGKHSLIPNGDTPETSAYNVIRTSDVESEYIYSREYVTGITENGTRSCFSFPQVGGQLGIFKVAMTTNVYAPGEIVINAYDPQKDLRVQEKQFFFQKYTYAKDGKEQTVDLGEYCNWMFYEEQAMLITGRGEKDFPIYRYPEVLLIAAEAIAQTEGVTTEAVNYLADVRARAYTQIARTEIVAQLIGLTKDAFIQEVWGERLREFPLECKVWDDIQRTRMYPKASAKDPGKLTFIPVLGATNPWGATYKEEHLLWPISKNEIQRNPSLEQNPGFR